MSNREEYLAGTAPLDPASSLCLTVTRTDTEVVVGFTAQANRTYRLEYRDDLSVSQWWVWMRYGATPTVQDYELRFPRTFLSGTRYFRVVLPAQP